MVQYGGVISVNVHQAKTRLSHYLSLVARGKRVVLCRRNIPIAEIRPLRGNRPRRAIGLCQTRFEVPESFFEPLPQKIIAAFKNPR